MNKSEELFMQYCWESGMDDDDIRACSWHKAGMIDFAYWLLSQNSGKPIVSGSLPPYDGELLKRLWTERNPQHETNADTGEDMFWRTAFMVMADYMQLVCGNDR